MAILFILPFRRAVGGTEGRRGMARRATWDGIDDDRRSTTTMVMATIIV